MHFLIIIRLPQQNQNKQTKNYYYYLLLNYEEEEEESFREVLLINNKVILQTGQATRADVAAATSSPLHGIAFLVIFAVERFASGFLVVISLSGANVPGDGAALDFDTNDNPLSLREAKRRAKYLNSKPAGREESTRAI